ncbi:SRPBCC family protein [Streptomyces sp. DSM 42041]|uniref:SRPBCC family protein n=1 Tax=Streptomyces hazeniae TaxID=3075538 RepID=A0ABU2NXU2_9ACTN|nr:SRPBCC family protein [Streptomyces sp. DSM 42041]MDT0381559.1 SRPBCC family protein [Streptomyces sp. DSM 42041]
MRTIVDARCRKTTPPCTIWYTHGGRKGRRPARGGSAVRVTTQVGIDAPPERVWEVLTAVGDWPDFVPTVDRLTVETPGPLGHGSRARIKQPGMPALRWRVTAFEAGASFAWTARGGGVTTTGGHRVAPRPGGGSLLELSIDQRGPLAPLVRAVFGARTRRYVETEARSVKARAEATPPHVSRGDR